MDDLEFDWGWSVWGWTYEARTNEMGTGMRVNGYHTNALYVESVAAIFVAVYRDGGSKFTEEEINELGPVLIDLVRVRHG